MSDNLDFTIIDGIKCFSPKVATTYTDYPNSGFDLTDKNAENSFWVSARNRLFKTLVYKYLLPSGKTKFLEIGCGTGDFIRQIAQNDKLDITGSEIYLKGLVYAKKHLPSINFIQLDVTEGKIDDQFDIIAAFDVIEHIENDNIAITNINQMLAKDGVLIISVPQHKFLWSRLDVVVKHKRRYTRRELITKLQENGFNINFYTSFVFTLFPFMMLSRIFDNDQDKSPSDSDEIALEKRVKFSRFLNGMFDLLMRIDEGLIRMGFSLPFGGTLIVVAKKR